MRLLVAGLTVAMTLAMSCGAFAQSPLPRESAAGPPAPASAPAISNERGAENTAELETLEALHRESIATRRALADSVLVAGLVSLAGGAALVIPDADDQAWRFAGFNDLIGLARSAHYHSAFVDGFSPSFAFVPASRATSYGSEIRVGFGKAF